jgi:uncharacterized protein with NRDE domain
MCIIAFCLQTAPGLPLLVAANRDERRSRPTQAAAPWQLDNGVQVLSGRDLTDGGTWMGCARNGRVAMLTNIRPTDALTEKARLSRGLLCADWLEGASLTTWLGQHVGGDFGGCNVVLGELTSGAWHFLRNHPETAADCVDNQLAPMGVGWWGCPLESGIHVLSNASLDTPWPNVVALRQAVLEATVTSPDTRAKEVPSGAMQVALLEALRDRQRYEPPVSAQSSSAFDRSALHALSACFVDWAEKDYGTRSSTLMWVSSAQTDTVGLQEWTYVNGAIDQASSAGPQYLRMG